MEKDYINECEIEGHPDPLTAGQLKIILGQIEKCICDIKCSINSHGTGFFCKIPYPDFYNIKWVLITNYHVLNKDDIVENKIIKFSLNEKSNTREIKITNKRKTYANEKFDVTIIELNPKEDSLEPDSFFEVDTKINCNNPNDEFRNNEVYIIGNINQYTNGRIKYISEDGKDIEYSFSTKPGMSGSPIINLNNYKIIGIHKGAKKNKKSNVGNFLRDPLKEFYTLTNLNYEIIKNVIINKNDDMYYKEEDIDLPEGAVSAEVKQKIITNSKGKPFLLVHKTILYDNGVTKTFIEKKNLVKK